MKNRILSGFVVVAILLVSAATAIAATHTVADDFSSGGYSGSTGNTAWEGDWVEIGESDGPTAGLVRVEPDTRCVGDPCLTLGTALGLGNVGARRTVDLGAATSASLSYHLDFPGGILIGGQILAEASVGGRSWETLMTHHPGAKGEFTVDLPVGDAVGVRFVTSGLSLGASAAVDDVVVVYDAPDPTTTSTSSSTTSSTSTSTSTTTSLPSSLREDDDNGAPPAGGTDQTPTERDESGKQFAPGIPFDVPGVSPPSSTHGVVTDLTPRLGGARELILEAQADLLVDFSTDVEDISLDLLASAALGFLFAVLWSRRLGEPDSPNG